MAPLLPHLAHISYVTNAAEQNEYYGSNWDFFVPVLTNPGYLVLMLLTTQLAVILYLFINHNLYLQKKIRTIQISALSYSDLIGWICRLSLGIGLIGAATENSLISPSLPGHPEFATIQTIIGFLLLSGFLLPIAFLGTIIVYGIGLSQAPYLLGNLDLLSLALIGLIAGNKRPGLDDLLKICFFSPFKSLKTSLPLIIRLGLGGAMTFLAIYEKFLNPMLSEFVVKKYSLQSFIPVSSAMWVFSVGAIEAILGILIIVGLRTRLISAIAFLVLSSTFFYFQESVTAHVTLFGSLSVLFITGSGQVFSLDQTIAEK